MFIMYVAPINMDCYVCYSVVNDETLTWKRKQMAQ